MALFKVFRGRSESLANVPLHDGYAYFTTDDGGFYIDSTKTENDVEVLQRFRINPTVPEWAKQQSKPNYTASEVGADPSGSAAAVQSNLDAVTAKIPSAASSTNKLVSASEMGDAIEAVEAKQLYATNAQGSFATKAALTGATTFYNAGGSPAMPTKNDVAYVLADESHSGKSAKYVVSNDTTGGASPVWGFVITFSNTTFSQAQMNAINSGIDNAKRAGYDTHVADSTIHVTAQDKGAWNGKSGKAESFSVTLSASGWSGNAQTVSDDRFVVAGYAYTVAPVGASVSAYGSSGIYADDVTIAGMMTFHCSEVPTEALTINVLKTEANE